MTSIAVLRGDIRVALDKNCEFTAILGSCVAVCMFDEQTGIGGMSHALLPVPNPETGASDRATLYSAQAVRALRDALTHAGANAADLRAKVFGGGMVISTLQDIGARNVRATMQALAEKKVPVTGQDVGGQYSRRLRFHPYSGLVSLAKTDTALQQTRIAARAAARYP